MRQVVERVRGREIVKRRPRPEPGAASLYQAVPFRQDTTYLSIGERTNANGSKAFKEAMLAERWDDCIEIARAQARDGAHLLDVCIDYVGRDGVADMREVVEPVRHRVDLPLVLDSTEPAVLEAGLELLGGPGTDQLGELRGRRRTGVPVRAADAGRHGARRRGRRAHDRRGGAGAYGGVEGTRRHAPHRGPHGHVGACGPATS
jgi:hypothetical protein